MRAGLHQSAKGTVPTATVTGCLLGQAWLTSVGSRLVLTTALGSGHHHRPSVLMLLLGIIVTDPSLHGHHTVAPTAHCPSGGGPVRPSCLARDCRLPVSTQLDTQEGVPKFHRIREDRFTHPSPPPTANTQWVTQTSAIVMKLTMPCFWHFQHKACF